uniref:Uncharacterized protein n=1 Tax=Anguilla anguilla TaxID=7936 RepID=A0A0E9SUZ4_ANGAN
MLAWLQFSFFLWMFHFHFFPVPYCLRKLFSCPASCLLALSGESVSLGLSILSLKVFWYFFQLHSV